MNRSLHLSNKILSATPALRSMPAFVLDAMHTFRSSIQFGPRNGWHSSDVPSVGVISGISHKGIFSNTLWASRASTYDRKSLAHKSRKWHQRKSHRDVTHEKRRLPRSVLLSWTCAPHHNSVQFSTSQVPETLQGCGAFAMFTSKCASMLHASKSAPSMWCFVHFGFDMGFLPQPHGLCRRLNFQGCSEGFVFSTFFERASRHSCLHFFDISTSKGGPNPRSFCYFHFQCASRHNGMQFFLSHTTRWLRTRRFSEPTSRATKHWKKTQCFATFLPFHAPASSFFWLFLFSDSSHLCFSICPYCRKFDFQTSFD